jgi:hypothetical protein
MLLTDRQSQPDVYMSQFDRQTMFSKLQRLEVP